jgi:enoyl-CoA hydratase/carnithine racemase
MDNTTIRLSFDGPLARLVLARPERGNLIDARLLHELEDAASQINERVETVVTLLEAEGDAFCIGWDDAMRDDLLARRLDPSDAGAIDPFGALAALPGPVVAAVQGEARSAGLELALVCDLRIAADDARFSLPDVVEGRLPLAGGSQRLPRIAGRAQTLAMLLTGDAIDAAAAYRCGLVSRVLPRDELAAAAEALARHIAERGPIALRLGKEAVHRGLDLTLDQALRYETDLAVILQTTADRAEGVRAFLEKRPPNFEGS